MQSVNPPVNSALRKTPLNALHRCLGAKMVNFGGWDMPVEYPSSGGLVAEHRAVRNGVGIFDVSHMGDIRIHTARQAGGGLRAVQHLTMNDASKLAIGQAQYSAMLYPEGTFVDDVIVHRLGEDDYLLVINAGTREKDIHWVKKNTANFDCAVEDLSDSYTQLAMQGPRAVDVLRKLTDANLDGVRNYWFTNGTVCGLERTLIARTGYTGEDGFEIYVPANVATSERVWNAVIEAGKEFGIVPCGLGARNTLRLEAKMALYEHEISDSINVWEAGLDRYCKMDKGDFVGRAGLEKARAAGCRADVGRAGDGGTRNCAGRVWLPGRNGKQNWRGDQRIAFADAREEYCARVCASGSCRQSEQPFAWKFAAQKCKAQIVATPFYKRITEGHRELGTSPKIERKEQ